MLHNEQPVKSSLKLVRPVNSVLELRILVIQRRCCSILQKEDLINFSLEVVLLRSKVNGDLFSDAVEPLSYVIPIHLLTALMQLSALLDLVAPFLSLSDAQASLEEYEPRAEQVLQSIGDCDENLLLDLLLGLRYRCRFAFRLHLRTPWLWSSRSPALDRTLLRSA